MASDSATIVDGLGVEAGVGLFTEVRKLGTVRVPKDWSHRTKNSDLRILLSGVIDEWDERIDGDKYPRPTAAIKPDQRINVDLWKPTNPCSPTILADELAFIASKGGLLIGIPGAALTMSQLKSTLKPDEILSFPDRPDRLIEGADMIREMPTVTVGRGKFDVQLQDASEGRAPTQMLVLFTQFLR